MKKNLTNNELRIYQYCKDHPNDVYGMRISELAESTYTTAPSISKLVKKLGFNNYQEFKINIRDAFTMSRNNPDYNNFLEKYINVIHNALLKLPHKDVQEFCGFLNGCRNIVTWGYGTSSSVAKYISYNLMVFGFNILNEVDFTNCNVRSIFLGSNDCFLIISNSGESEMIEEIICNAKKRGCKIAAITSRKQSFLAKNSDALLIHEDTVLKDTIFENISFSAQIAVVDTILFNLSLERKSSLKINSKEEEH